MLSHYTRRDDKGHTHAARGEGRRRGGGWRKNQHVKNRGRGGAKGKVERRHSVVARRSNKCSLISRISTTAGGGSS